MCTDGWKKRACEQGASLVNCIVLKPSGGCIFIQAKRLDGDEKKDAEFIAKVRRRKGLQLPSSSM